MVGVGEVALVVLNEFNGLRRLTDKVGDSRLEPVERFECPIDVDRIHIARRHAVTHQRDLQGFAYARTQSASPRKAASVPEFGPRIRMLAVRVARLVPSDATRVALVRHLVVAYRFRNDTFQI